MVGDQDTGRLAGGTSHPERSGEVVEGGHRIWWGTKTLVAWPGGPHTQRGPGKWRRVGTEYGGGPRHWSPRRRNLTPREVRGNGGGWAHFPIWWGTRTLVALPGDLTPRKARGSGGGFGTLPNIVGDQDTGRLVGGASHPERPGEVVQGGHTSQYGRGPGHWSPRWGGLTPREARGSSGG